MKKKTVCVDLDGTLCKYDGWHGVENIGEPIPGAVEFTKKLSEFANIVVYTTRTNSNVNSDRGHIELFNIVKDYLNKHGFVFDSIYIGEGKPLCAAFIDDRAISCRPQDSPDSKMEYTYALDLARLLCNNKE